MRLTIYNKNISKIIINGSHIKQTTINNILKTIKDKFLFIYLIEILMN
jgi:hypothetical protein